MNKSNIHISFCNRSFIEYYKRRKLCERARPLKPVTFFVYLRSSEVQVLFLGKNVGKKWCDGNSQAKTIGDAVTYIDALVNWKYQLT